MYQVLLLPLMIFGHVLVRLAVRFIQAMHFILSNLQTEQHGLMYLMLRQQVPPVELVVLLIIKQPVCLLITGPTGPTGAQGAAGVGGTGGLVYGTGFTGNIAAMSSNGMIGLAMPYTPQSSGTVLVGVEGYASMSSALGFIELAYGTGTAPVVNGGFTGVTFGAFIETGLSSSSGNLPFTLLYPLSGLIVGTRYWFDIYCVVSAGTPQIRNPKGFVLEL